VPKAADKTNRVITLFWNLR